MVSLVIGESNKGLNPVADGLDLVLGEGVCFVLGGHDFFVVCGEFDEVDEFGIIWGPAFDDVEFWIEGEDEGVESEVGFLLPFAVTFDAGVVEDWLDDGVVYLDGFCGEVQCLDLRI